MAYYPIVSEMTDDLLAKIRFKKAMIEVINGETCELPDPRHFFLSRASARQIILQLMSQIS